jgi:hypothetical protein
MFTRSGSRFAAPRGMLAPFVTFALFMTVVGGTLAVNDPVSLPHEPAELAAGVPVAVSGTLLGVVDGHLAVREDGATAPVAFPLATVAHVARGGDASSVEALRPGDELRLSVDATTGRVLRIDAAPSRPWPSPRPTSWRCSPRSASSAAASCSPPATAGPRPRLPRPSAERRVRPSCRVRRRPKRHGAGRRCLPAEPDRRPLLTHRPPILPPGPPPPVRRLTRPAARSPRSPLPVPAGRPRRPPRCPATPPQRRTSRSRGPCTPPGLHPAPLRRRRPLAASGQPRGTGTRPVPRGSARPRPDSPTAPVSRSVPHPRPRTGRSAARSPSPAPPTVLRATIPAPPSARPSPGEGGAAPGSLPDRRPSRAPNGGGSDHRNAAADDVDAETVHEAGDPVAVPVEWCAFFGRGSGLPHGRRSRGPRRGGTWSAQIAAPSPDARANGDRQSEGGPPRLDSRGPAHPGGTGGIRDSVEQRGKPGPTRSPLPVPVRGSGVGWGLNADGAPGFARRRYPRSPSAPASPSRPAPNPRPSARLRERAGSPSRRRRRSRASPRHPSPPVRRRTSSRSAAPTSTPAARRAPP